MLVLATLLSMLCIVEDTMASGSTCPELTKTSTVGEHNMAWTCEQINWRNALAKWKQVADEMCNISLADAYWKSVFVCPDFSNITCFDESAVENETDLFNCSIIFCNDGMYLDDMTFLEVWRQHFLTHQAIMTIYENKLIDCGQSECLDSDTITIHAWNSLNHRYVDILRHLSLAEDRITQLEYNSSAWDDQVQKYSQLSGDLTYSAMKTQRLENLIKETFANLSTSMIEVKDQIQQIENRSKVWDSYHQTFSDLSNALEDHKDEIQTIQNQTAEKFANLSSTLSDEIRSVENENEEKMSNLSSALNEARGQILQIQNKSEGWDATTRKHSNMSIALAAAKLRITKLENLTQNLALKAQQHSEALAKAEEKISNLTIANQNLTAQAQENSETLAKAGDTILDLQSTNQNVTARLSELENISSTLSYGLLSCNSEGGLYYRQKCYTIPHLSSTKDMDFNAAGLECAKTGAFLAEIHDRSQQDAVYDFALSKAPGGTTYFDIWVGMEYQSSTLTLLYRSGKRTASIRLSWRPSFPTPHSSNKYAGLTVRSDGSSDFGLWNYGRPEDNSNGVLCEKLF